MESENDSKLIQSKQDVHFSSNDKVYSDQEVFERHDGEEFDDNSQNQATRASTWSLPISDSSKFKSKVNTNSSKSKHKKASAIDMPLQRNNIEAKNIDVSPIIEDDKEETVDEESNLKTPLPNNLFKDYINSEFKSIKDTKIIQSKKLIIIFNSK